MRDRNLKNAFLDLKNLTDICHHRDGCSALCFQEDQAVKTCPVELRKGFSLVLREAFSRRSAGDAAGPQEQGHDPPGLRTADPTLRTRCTPD